jgi:hypothetical protein
MHARRTSRLSVLLVICITGVVSLAAHTAAQSPSPAGSGQPRPPGSPSASTRSSPEATGNPYGWPQIRFVGGVPELMTVTSDCGIPGVDTFHLQAVGQDMTGWLDVTLTDYDESNMRFTGREVGQIFAENDTVYQVDDEVGMWFDLGSGNWYLKGFWMDKVPIDACLPVPSPGP